MRKKEIINDSFGNTASHRMPCHLFGDAVSIDHSTAVPADITKQNFSVCPRHWYVDAEYECRRCKKQFTWSAAEQRVWFEDYFFWIDAYPGNCLACRKSLKHLVKLRREYDSIIAHARHGTVEQKRRVIDIIDELAHGIVELPAKMIETRRVFERQLG
jgi:hypothetical protein